MRRKKTSFGYENEVSGRRVTKMDDVGNQPSEKGLANSPESPPNTARIVGVLISYSRKPAGEIFPIREGKNTIGSGETSDGSPCDIWFPEDHKMSGFHALIRYLRGKYQIVDQTSTNGTFVNGEEIDKLELPNYSHLQLGRTKFLFIKTEDSTISREEARIEVEEPVVESPGPIHKPKKDPTLF